MASTLIVQDARVCSQNVLKPRKRTVTATLIPVRSVLKLKCEFKLDIDEKTTTADIWVKFGKSSDRPFCHTCVN